MFSFFLLPNGHISHHYNLEILYCNLNQNTQNCIIHLIEKSSKILIILVFYSTLFEMCLLISQWKKNRCTKKTITLINRCIKKKYHGTTLFSDAPWSISQISRHINITTQLVPCYILKYNLITT